MDDLLREFLTETNESLDTVDVELVRFEQEPNNAKILDNIFRLVHTIKGTCGFLGLPRLEALAHAAETLMGKFRDGMPVTGDAVTLILSTIDRLKEVLGGLEQNEAEPEGSDADLIGELERMAIAGTVAAAKEEPKPAKAATSGTLVAQTLERPLRPGEVSLDDLERAFRETARRGRAPRRRDAPAPKAEVAQDRGEAEARQGRAQAGRRRRGEDRQGRQPVDPRERRHAGTPDDHGLGAGAHAQPAARDRAPPRGLGVQGPAAAALERHRRAAGRRHEDAHAADRQCLAEAAAHHPRPRGRTEEGHRARDARRRDRARPPGARSHQGPAHPHGAQLGRPRPRDDRAAPRRRQAREGHDPPLRLSRGRPHHHRDRRRRARPEHGAHQAEGARERARDRGRAREDDAKRRSTSSSSRPASRPPPR